MPNSLAHLRPRSDTLYVSQGYTVLATEQDGFVGNGAEHGLFVHETRLLSRYRWLIVGQPPQPVALSNTAQHTWLGYYIAPPPGDDKPETDSGQVPDAAQQTIEMRVSRYAGGGIHEDVDLTNFTQRPVAFTLELEAEADFADHPFPALYPRANWPQAWSSSTVFSLVQALLGLYPYAPLNMLLLDPHLPEWLPEITIGNLRIGDGRITIRFRRKEDGTSDYEILDKYGALHVLRQPSPWSLTASFGERLKDALTSR